MSASRVTPAYEPMVGGDPGASAKASGRCPGETRRCWAMIGAAVVVVLLLASIGGQKLVVNKLTETAIKQFVTLSASQDEGCNENYAWNDLAEKVWWPGCYNNFTYGSTCGEPCFGPEFIKEIIDFNQEQDPGHIVEYKNLPGKGHGDLPGVETVTLRGWLLPAAKPSEGVRPRVVVQHGFTENSNKYRQVVLATMLRQLGFDVLVNNLRDHCYSDDSKANIIQWGHAYPNDLLGAWEYLKKDPDGHLGGEVDAGQVGIIGVSMGALTAVNAFGMGAEVPAAWVDSPPSKPKFVFKQGMKTELEKIIGSFFAGILAAGHMTNRFMVDPVWKNVEDFALAKGIDLNEHTPASALPTGPDTKRPFTLVGNLQDTTVPWSETVASKDIAEMYPEKYKLQVWQSDSTCKLQIDIDAGKSATDHCVDHISHFAEYKAKLCLFWYEVFGLSAHLCAKHFPDVEHPEMKDFFSN